MKIIFESQKEKLDFVQWVCPNYLKNPETCPHHITCEECWEREHPGVMEVKDENHI